MPEEQDINRFIEGIENVPWKQEGDWANHQHPESFRAGKILEDGFAKTFGLKMNLDISKWKGDNGYDFDVNGILYDTKAISPKYERNPLMLLYEGESLRAHIYVHGVSDTVNCRAKLLGWISREDIIKHRIVTDRASDCCRPFPLYRTSWQKEATRFRWVIEPRYLHNMSTLVVKR